MTNGPITGDAATLLSRLAEATNAHDVGGIEACFAAGYRNETPAHPARSFVGREQVRRNWEQILQFVPDIKATVLRSVAQDGVVWSEWDHRGTRRDGTRHHMCGVIIFGVEHEAIAWARFYLEPVEREGGDVNQAVRTQVAPSPATGEAR